LDGNLQPEMETNEYLNRTKLARVVIEYSRQHYCYGERAAAAAVERCGCDVSRLTDVRRARRLPSCRFRFASSTSRSAPAGNETDPIRGRISRIVRTEIVRRPGSDENEQQTDRKGLSENPAHVTLRVRILIGVRVHVVSVSVSQGLGPRGLSTTPRTALGQKVVALALALVLSILHVYSSTFVELVGFRIGLVLGLGLHVVGASNSTNLASVGPVRAEF